MTKVIDLLPGDEVTSGPMHATFIVSTSHHKYHGLALVVWRMPDGSLSPDALSYLQDVGEVTASTRDERNARLLGALDGAQ